MSYHLCGVSNIKHTGFFRVADGGRPPFSMKKGMGKGIICMTILFVMICDSLSFSIISSYEKKTIIEES